MLGELAVASDLDEVQRQRRPLSSLSSIGLLAVYERPDDVYRLVSGKDYRLAPFTLRALPPSG
jgi:hypothetical protein